MRALQLARALRAPLVSGSRSMATAVHSSPSAQEAVIPLSNVEAQWARLSTDEQQTVYRQLEQLQTKDWKELSIDEKKAGTYHTRIKF